MSKPLIMGKLISFRMSQDMIALTKEAAENLGISRSDLIRAAIARFLEKKANADE